MKKLYLVRHGQTVLNVAGVYAGRTETPLTDEGRAQARLAGKHATSLNIDAIACSSQGRAVETAEIIAKEVGLTQDNLHKSSLLIERHFGAMEGQPWQPDLDLDGITDIEAEHELVSRVRLAREWLETLPYNNILVVTHGSTGRALQSLFFENVSPMSLPHLKNAEIVELL